MPSHLLGLKSVMGEVGINNFIVKLGRGISCMGYIRTTNTVAHNNKWATRNNISVKIGLKINGSTNC